MTRQKEDFEVIYKNILDKTPAIIRGKIMKNKEFFWRLFSQTTAHAYEGK